MMSTSVKKEEDPMNMTFKQKLKKFAEFGGGKIKTKPTKQQQIKKKGQHLSKVYQNRKQSLRTWTVTNKKTDIDELLHGHHPKVNDKALNKSRDSEGDETEIIDIIDNIEGMNTLLSSQLNIQDKSRDSEEYEYDHEIIVDNINININNAESKSAVLMRTYYESNMYNIDLSTFIGHGELTIDIENDLELDYYSAEDEAESNDENDENDENNDDDESYSSINSESDDNFLRPDISVIDISNEYIGNIYYSDFSNRDKKSIDLSAAGLLCTTSEEEEDDDDNQLLLVKHLFDMFAIDIDVVIAFGDDPARKLIDIEPCTFLHSYPNMSTNITTKELICRYKVSHFLMTKVLEDGWSGLCQDSWANLNTNSFFYIFATKLEAKVLPPLPPLSPPNYIVLEGYESYTLDTVIVNSKQSSTILFGIDKLGQDMTIELIILSKGECFTIAIDDMGAIYEENAYIGTMLPHGDNFIDGGSEIFIECEISESGDGFGILFKHKKHQKLITDKHIGMKFADSINFYESSVLMDVKIGQIEGNGVYSAVIL